MTMPSRILCKDVQEASKLGGESQVEDSIEKHPTLMEAKVVPEKWREAQEEAPTSGGRDTITTQKHLLLKPA
jgi:hypothetical protein